jgi:hypothetical protein
LVDYLDEAYAVLSDAERRRAYDAQRGNGTTPSRSPSHAVTPLEPRRNESAQAPDAGVSVSNVRPASGGAGSGSALDAISTAAVGALGVIGKQLSSLSRRGREQSDEWVARHHEEPVDNGAVDEEASFLVRLSSSVDQSRAELEGTNSVATVSVEDGPDSGRTFSVRSMPITIGEDDDCDIRLKDAPPRAARVMLRDGLFVVYHLASRGPEDMDSERCEILQSGGHVQLGPYRLRFTRN